MPPLHGTIQLKVKSVSDWTTDNDILLDGQVGIESTGTPRKFKIGDGITAWNDLSYAVDNTGVSKAYVDAADAYLQSQLDDIVSTPGPKGDKGDKGDTGDQGIQGEKGDKGDPGDVGSIDLTPYALITDVNDTDTGLQLEINDLQARADNIEANQTADETNITTLFGQISTEVTNRSNADTALLNKLNDIEGLALAGL